MNHFQDKTEKLLVVNTDCNNWIEFVANHIGFEYSKYFKTNVSSVEKNNKKLIEAKTVLDNTFKELRYTEDQRRTLNINKRLASLYKNNIEWSLYPTESGISFVLGKRKRG